MTPVITVDTLSSCAARLAVNVYDSDAQRQAAEILDALSADRELLGVLNPVYRVGLSLVALAQEHDSLLADSIFDTEFRSLDHRVRNLLLPTQPGRPYQILAHMVLDAFDNPTLWEPFVPAFETADVSLPAIVAEVWKAPAPDPRYTGWDFRPSDFVDSLLANWRLAVLDRTIPKSPIPPPASLSESEILASTSSAIAAAAYELNLFSGVTADFPLFAIQGSKYVLAGALSVVSGSRLSERDLSAALTFCGDRDSDELGQLTLGELLELIAFVS